MNKELKKGKYDQCFGCRNPITEEDKKLYTYKKGVTCKYCYHIRTKNQINSSVTRQKQIDMAEKNNLIHPFKKIL